MKTILITGSTGFIGSNLTSEFNKRDCKIIGLSVDSIKEHLEWIKDIEELSNKKLNFPIIADENLIPLSLTPHKYLIICIAHSHAPFEVCP